MKKYRSTLWRASQNNFCRVNGERSKRYMGPRHSAPRSGPQSGPLRGPLRGPQTSAVHIAIRSAVHKNKKRKIFVGELSPQKQISRPAPYGSSTAIRDCRPKKRRSSRVSPIWQNFWGSKNL
jgi:hypothetical protein